MEFAHDDKRGKPLGNHYIGNDPCCGGCRCRVAAAGGRLPARRAMKNTQPPLRTEAEARLAAGTGQTGVSSARSKDQLLHELQVHQIELELQNDELNRARADTEAALERYADFYDFSPVGLFTLDQGGVITRVNLAGAQLLGQERSRINGQRLLVFIGESSRQTFNAFLERMFAGETRLSCELTLVADGQPKRLVELTAVLSPDRHECRIAVVDITERQRVADMLRESGQFNAEVIANAQEGIVVYGLDLRYLVWNDYMERFTGMKACDVLGRLPLEVFPFLEEGGVWANLKKALAGGPSILVEFPFTVKQTGNSGWAMDRTSPLRNARGEIIGAISTVTDITMRRAAEDALKASEQRYRDLVDTVDGMVWEADPNTLKNTFMSRQAERLLGYPVENWMQPGFWTEILHPDDRDWARAYCTSAIGRGQPFEFEYRLVASDGRIVWVHDMVNIEMEGGAPRWLRGITVDVTARKRAEQELRDMASSLEQTVADRTGQLRQLAAQLSMAEERERHKLAQDLHDNLGQLLAVIRIKLSSIDAGSSGRTAAALIELVQQAEESVRTVTAQLSPPVLHTLGLVPALEWLGEEIERVYDLRVHVDHDNCRKHLVDEVQAVLYRSVRELLINVAKHAGVDEASLSCFCDGGRLNLVVSDAGSGFDPAGHMGPWSGHNSFGLRSINERIRNLGGEVEIDSSPGNGSTITLSVPCSTLKREICDDSRNACG